MDTVQVGDDGQSCADGTGSGACIAVSYYGDGCAVVQTCGGTVEGTTYYRVRQDCTVETFTGNVCGYNPLDWSLCAWTTPTPEEQQELGACAPPSEGPPACQCACPGEP